MATSPTARSLKKLRDEGYIPAVVEQTLGNTFIKRDLWNVFDILAIRGEEILGVQATSDNGGNVSARVRKIADAEHIGAIRDAGIRAEVWGWRKKGNRWQVRIVDCS